ncbi:MAG: hypothetical protein ACLQU2_09705 [Candidatus Binataceae bacterium]
MTFYDPKQPIGKYQQQRKRGSVADSFMEPDRKNALTPFGFADTCAHYDKLYPSAAAPPDRVCSSRLGLSEQNAETQKYNHELSFSPAFNIGT